MSENISPAFEQSAPEKIINIPENERARLSEAIQKLLATGSISGLEGSSLYHWCRQYFEWVKEFAAIAGLDVAMFHEERLIQAIPQTAALRLRLRKDDTLVWIALWYAGDVRWRDEGQDQAFLSVSELNGLLQDQLLPDVSAQIPRGRMREILSQASRYNLIRLEISEPFDESGIEVLPAIRRAVPFRNLVEWTTAAEDFQQPSEDDSSETPVSETDATQDLTPNEEEKEES